MLKTAALITMFGHLNPIIKGWANYYSTVVSKKVYSQLDSMMYTKLKSWAERRHPNKSGRWIAMKYWQTIGGNNWVFATSQKGNNLMRLHEHSETNIVRHVKIKCEESPFVASKNCLHVNRV